MTLLILSSRNMKESPETSTMNFAGFQTKSELAKTAVLSFNLEILPLVHYVYVVR